MKLRVRSLESKETLKIQTPSPSSLQDLKSAIAEKVSCFPEYIHLSLNRKDELDSSPPNNSLQSFGITSGDLIFYTLNPNGFSRETLIQTPSPKFEVSNRSDLHKKTLEKPQSSNSQMSDFNPDETLALNPQEEETLAPIPQQEETLASNAQQQETLASNAQQEETLGYSKRNDENPCDLDDMDVDEPVIIGKSSVPCFLRRVFKEEVGKAEGNCKLLIIAVHAVLLESEFVCFDPSTKKKIDGLSLPEGWNSTSTTMVSLLYTVPDLISSDVVETIVLRFQVLGKYVIFYGSLTGKGSDAYRLCLDTTRFLPSINCVWMNCNAKGSAANERDGSSKSTGERDIFEFWKIVKDGLALPLLIDICEKTGLAPPPCFMRLPTELKLKLLESLPGVDIAKVGLLCSELRYLSSNSDLWKQKFSEEFGLSDAEGSQGESYWKERFAVYWVRRKRSMNAARKRPYNRGRPHNFVIPHFPEGMLPFGFPGIVGGDYDRLPGLGIPNPFGTSRDFPRFPARRNFSPHCNLGGFNA